MREVGCLAQAESQKEGELLPEGRGARTKELKKLGWYTEKKRLLINQKVPVTKVALWDIISSLYPSGRTRADGGQREKLQKIPEKSGGGTRFQSAAARPPPAFLTRPRSLPNQTRHSPTLPAAPHTRPHARWRLEGPVSRTGPGPSAGDRWWRRGRCVRGAGVCEGRRGGRRGWPGAVLPSGGGPLWGRLGASPASPGLLAVWTAGRQRRRPRRHRRER